MVAVSDFNEWLDTVEFEDYEDINCLYRSVDECTAYGRFDTQEARGVNNGWIVSADDVENALRIPTEKARACFLSIIEDRCCDGMSMEGWYDYYRQMDKED